MADRIVTEAATSPEWEECPVCEGAEGHAEGERGDIWVDCPNCEGAGGWSK